MHLWVNCSNFLNNPFFDRQAQGGQKTSFLGGMRVVISGYRYYSAEIGRWGSRDPLKELGNIVIRGSENELESIDLNLYVFCLNDPVTDYDLFGLFRSHWLLRLLVPGQIYWDDALTALENDDYAGAGINTAGMVIEQLMTVYLLVKAPTPKSTFSCAYVQKAGTLTGSLKGLTQAERSMVSELLSQGKNVTIVPRSQGKTADFIIDGVLTELKTLTKAGTNTLKNAIQKASKQGPQILIDARNVDVTRSEVIKQIHRAQGNIGKLKGRVTVLIKNDIINF